MSFGGSRPFVGIFIGIMQARPCGVTPASARPWVPS